MGLLDIFRPSIDKATAELTDKGFDVAECDMDCGSCHTQFPSSVNFTDDDGALLWQSTKPFGLHAVVTTGKTDWPHDATLESGTLPHAVDQWASEMSLELQQTIGKVKVTVTSLLNAGLDAGDEEFVLQRKGDVLLLPLFVWVRSVTVTNVAPVLNAAIPPLIEARAAKRTDLGETLDAAASTSDVLAQALALGVQVAPSSSRAFIFLCSHRTRDKRCGITAPIMKKEMDIHLRDLNLIRDHGDARPGGVTVAYVNHVGGHKFAANVIIYIKATGDNIWFARCRPNNVQPIIDECVLGGGKVWPSKVRIAQKFEPVEW